MRGMRAVQFAILIAMFLIAGPRVRGQVSDPQLRAAIESEYPAIVTAEPWDRIRLLREYSYRHTAYATSVSTAAYAAGDTLVWSVVGGTTTLGDGYAFFDSANGGQVCGGISLMLMKLYQLY